MNVLRVETGARVRLTRTLRDLDGASFPEGLELVFLRATFFPHDDGVTLEFTQTDGGPLRMRLFAEALRDDDFERATSSHTTDE